MPQQFDVIVVGGGVIGLSSAWRLAQSGRQVLLLDSGPLGSEASSAAAGMLGAQLEVKHPGSFYHLCLESRSLYQKFVDELLAQTGIDPELTHNGILKLARTAEEADVLQRQRQWQIKEGARAEWADASSVQRAEPDLAPCLGALSLPDDSNVQAPLLVRALSAAVHHTCTVKEGTPATDIVAQPGGGFTVATPAAAYQATTVVVAAGAWAQRLLAPFNLSISIQPVKGQLLSIRPRRGHRLKSTVVTPDVYMVPKRDGSIVVGATEERGAGFNRDVTIDAMHQLMAAVISVAPGLADSIFARSWMGLRPGSANGEPWIGEHPAVPGLHVAVGHFRNGILLSAVTGQMIVASVEGKPVPGHWRAFAPQQRLANQASV